MKLSYTEYIEDMVKKVNTGDPIYSDDIAEAIKIEYGITKKEAAANTAVSLKRLMDRRTIPELRNYQKGIYFRTAVTPFGETGINKDKLISDRYLSNDNGYYGGYRLLHQMGLTNQMPNNLMVVTNKAGKNSRKDSKLEIIIMPPHTHITADNKEYLKILDILDLLQKAPVDVKEPYKILAAYIKKMELDYKKLLAYASQYYHHNTLSHLAKVAVEGEMLNEPA